MMLWLLVLACSDKQLEETGEPTETGDTDTGADTGVPYDGPTLIAELEADCDSEVWEYGARTDGLTSRADLHIVQTDSPDASYRTEVHSVPSVEADPLGWWDRLELELAIQEGSGINGVATGFSCVSDERRTLTWMLRVWDPDGAVADCRAWGHDPSWYQEYGCDPWVP